MPDYLDVARNLWENGENTVEAVTAAALVAIAEELHKINTRNDERDDIADRRQELEDARRNTWTGAP